MASVSTSVHVTVGTGVDRTGVGGTDEAVGEEVDAGAGKRMVGRAEGDTVSAVMTGSALGDDPAEQATRNTLATASKARSSNGLLTSSMVEAFHMDLFPPVFQLEVP
jgi:hypothetical protein